MKARAAEMTVGVFMLLGVFAMVVLAFKVSGLSMKSSEGNYKVVAYFENLGGLTERAKVAMSGVTIGRVTHIHLDTDDYVAVVEMEIDGDVTSLTTDTSAAILTAGLLGEKYVGLTVGADEEYLAEGDVIEDTQSALVLEELIGQFLFNKTSE